MKARVRCRKGASIEERLRLHMIAAPSGCWIWTGALSNGRPGVGYYGRFTLDGKTRYAHRVSYETFVGPVPEGLQLDHLCRRPSCINPMHLQPVTARVNVRRGTSPAARATRRDRCLKGHLYAEFSVVQGGRTYCRACTAASHRRYAAAASAERAQQKADRMARLIAYRDRNVRTGASA